MGPRLKDLDGISATEGAAIPRLYGRARMGGQVIWATRFEEEAVYSASRPRGGKSTTRRPQTQTQTQVSYRYSSNVAIGLCVGEIGFVRRVWADGKLLDLTTVTMRVHTGSEMQSADPIIIAKQGAASAPAYRGLAYVVFEKLPLEAYGNRLPQFTFEVVRPVHGLCRRIRAINLIPGAGEHVYEPGAVSASGRLGQSSLPNRSQMTHISDWHASLDALQALCPNLRHVALVVSWFGNDLRAGQCTIRPLTEPDARDGYPFSWAVAGLTRATAGVVSAPDGKAAYGGTPSDAGVMRAIRDLKARGLNVTLYPFVMMDIAPGNTRPDPWTGGISQPTYPWRGRITCDPAPGRPGTVEGSASADAQVAALFGTCTAAQFSTGTDTVSYTGPAEWSLRRLVLHCAALGKAAGGVDAIALASEFVALTKVRGAGAVNPAVAGLKAMAAEVRALTGAATKLTYGADWSEYGAEVRSGGTDVRFPLDPLWADPNIDAVSIDWYPPVTDWRDGLAHLDATAFDGPQDEALFAARVAGGEAFDWYYADDAGRAAQTRLPITDGAFGKPWTFRAKDLVGWWSNSHRPRSTGAEQAATAWLPGMKPIWLLELGCPAVDRGANQPNVFPDPKSSENALPVFSRGGRDDLVQARHLTATLDRFDPLSSGFTAAQNPVATAYAGRMLDTERVYLWTWDARPFPAFPQATSRWADAANYESGHWLNGRLEGLPVDDLIEAMLADRGQAGLFTRGAEGFIEGYVLDRPMALRAAIEPLANLFGFDLRASRGKLAAIRRGARAVRTLNADDVAVSGERSRASRTRAQASELPASLALASVDPDIDYRQSVVRAVVSDPATQRMASVETGAVLRRPLAHHRAGVMLQEARAARETLELDLAPSAIALEPGDTVAFEGKTFRIRRITDGRARRVSAVEIEPTGYLGAPPPALSRPRDGARFAGPPQVTVIDWPLAEGGEDVLQRIGVTADPWPGAFTLWRAVDGAATSFAPTDRLATSAIVAKTLTALPAGPLWRTDRAGVLDVELSHGALQSLSVEAMLAGGNLIAVEMAGQGWEVLAFQTATLIAPRTWRLSGFIRGLGGSEGLASLPKTAGARGVILDQSLGALASGASQLGQPGRYRVAPEGRDQADAFAVAFDATPPATALLPLSPVRLRAKREAGGVRLTWLRRTRSGGDSWELAEVPLGEAMEAYRVDILNGGVLKRRLEVSTPTAFYASADEVADFGAAQTVLSLRIQQISQAAGPGFAAQEIVAVG
jgi:GTA TIM-barrel-like domain/Putative phage tail protein